MDEWCVVVWSLPPRVWMNGVWWFGLCVRMYGLMVCGGLVFASSYMDKWCVVVWPLPPDVLLNDASWFGLYFRVCG